MSPHEIDLLAAAFAAILITAIERYLQVANRRHGDTQRWELD